MIFLRGVNTQKISETARTVVDSMSEIIWAIDPKNDKLENLVAYIREYASEYIEMAGITCRFEFPEQIPAFNLSAEVRRNIFLTVKEAIHNIIKHSHANVADFKLHLSHHQFELNIHDNGSGFDIIGKTGSGSGLINMKKRIEQIGGHFTFRLNCDRAQLSKSASQPLMRSKTLLLLCD